ncbi:MAG: tetratricopeptide repeat protein [Chitinophagales bacterium]|nr:PD40 domain-containing protein [Bacteroidota bacterium]MCB9043059.1 PD40 domain-containing protein [Chitinophagales bacterium]
MRNLVYSLIIASISLLSNPAFAQKSVLKAADAAYEQMNYSDAIDLYKTYLKKKKKDGDAIEKLADCYRKTSNYTQAEIWYRKAIRTNKKNDELKLYYAQSLMSNRKYGEAKEVLEEYIQDNPQDTRAFKALDWCNNVNTYMQDSSKYQLNKLSFNSVESDFGPAFYKNGLVFCSARTSGIFDKKDGWTGESYLDIYFTEPVNDIKWTEPHSLKGWEGTQYHEGPATLSVDGNTMYFTRNEKTKKLKDGKIALLNIYEVKKQNGKWSEPQAVSFSSKDGSYSIGHPSLSYDERYIYFTSDMPGGYGGKDLYVVERKGNKWSQPRNLGPNVNSAGDEMFPYIHPDGTLYFASDGWGGFGGLDIFYTKPDAAGKWQESKNIGYPINDSKDDFGLILSADKQLGYFASNRSLNSGDDIYQVFIESEKATKMLNLPENILAKTETVAPQLPMPSEKVDYKLSAALETPQPNSTQKIYLIGMLVDENTLSPLKNILVELMDSKTQTKFTYTTQIDGNFYFELETGKEYRLSCLRGNMVEASQKVSTVGKTNAEIIQVMLKLPTTKIVANKTELKDTFYTHPQNFASNYTSTTSSSVKSSDYMPTQPIASNQYAAYNLENIAFKVQVGAFSNPIGLSSSYLSKVRDNVMEEIDGGIYKYVVGYFTDYNKADNYREYIRSMGYPNAFLVAYKNGTRLHTPINELMGNTIR